MYHLLVLYGVIRYTICMENKYTHARTCVYNINYHIVWCVKYRRKVLSADISNRLIELLKAVGRTNIPVLLKRGLSATLEELVMSAEYIMAEGNPNVVLCERGIRTFETSMRNTLDISAVPMLKKMTHLPVVIDPSHAAGIAFMVPSLAKAAVAVGADGLMIEVHNDPARAKSDGAQSLTPDQFDDLMATIRPELEFFGKTLN